MTVPNQLPRVFAGPDVIINLPLDSVLLTGNATDDDGTIVCIDGRT